MLEAILLPENFVGEGGRRPDEGEKGREPEMTSYFEFAVLSFFSPVGSGPGTLTRHALRHSPAGITKNQSRFLLL